MLHSRTWDGQHPAHGARGFLFSGYVYLARSAQRTFPPSPSSRQASGAVPEVISSRSAGLKAFWRRFPLSGEAPVQLLILGASTRAQPPRGAAPPPNSPARRCHGTPLGRLASTFDVIYDKARSSFACTEAFGAWGTAREGFSHQR